MTMVMVMMMMTTTASIHPENLRLPRVQAPHNFVEQFSFYPTLSEVLEAL